MTVLALDVGDRRIGVAVSDPTRLLARPVTVLLRRSHRQDAEAIRRLADANAVELIVVGLPLTERGVGGQAEKVLAFVRFLRAHLPWPVETWDERFTTVDAQQALLAMGVPRRRRQALLDAAAAAVLLDDWLTAHRTSQSAGGVG